MEDKIKKNKIHSFMKTNRYKFSYNYSVSLENKMNDISKEHIDLITSLRYIDPVYLTVISLFLGMLAVDRILVGHTLLGILKFISFGGCGIWFIVDLVLSPMLAREYNQKQVDDLCFMIKHV